MLFLFLLGGSTSRSPVTIVSGFLRNVLRFRLTLVVRLRSLTTSTIFRRFPSQFSRGVYHPSSFLTLLPLTSVYGRVVYLFLATSGQYCFNLGIYLSRVGKQKGYPRFRTVFSNVLSRRQVFRPSVQGPQRSRSVPLLFRDDRNVFRALMFFFRPKRKARRKGRLVFPFSLRSHRLASMKRVTLFHYLRASHRNSIKGVYHLRLSIAGSLLYRLLVYAFCPFLPNGRDHYVPRTTSSVRRS